MYIFGFEAFASWVKYVARRDSVRPQPSRREVNGTEESEAVKELDKTLRNTRTNCVLLSWKLILRTPSYREDHPAWPWTVEYAGRTLHVFCISRADGLIPPQRILGKTCTTPRARIGETVLHKTVKTVRLNDDTGK